MGINADNLNSIYVTGYAFNESNDFFTAKLPNDGSGTGVYNVGTGSINYIPSNITESASSYLEQAATYTSSTTSLTVTTTAYTSTASSLTSSTTALIEGPGNGGLVWMKNRGGPAATDHALYDTARGATFDIASNTTAAQTTQSTGLTRFLANGFSIGSGDTINTTSAPYASWTFREQPKFFDIVTYTGNGANRTIAHNLGSVPGCIIVKRLNGIADWQVYHRSLANTQYQVLNSQSAAATGATRWNSTTPTDTVFSLGTDATVNASGGTYVAYLFAHNAGGFGDTGADNVISCGSYTGNGSTVGPVVTLGYEPQWLLIKKIGIGSGHWVLIDNMRGFVVRGTDAILNPNLTAVETASTRVTPTATGFQLNTIEDFYNENGSTFMYIAIRRGPMRTPTTGTSVFAPFSISTTSTDATYVTNFPVDMAIAGQKNSNNASDNWTFVDRLRGMTANNNGDGAASRALLSTSAVPEAAQSFPDFYNVWNTTLRQGTGLSGASVSYQFFRRAPGFFDAVCYTGDGVNGRSVSHNLTVQPELLIIKSRDLTNNWQVFRYTDLTTRIALSLNLTNAATGPLTNLQVSSTAFTVASASTLNGSGNTYVAYLFASCPGVSKVGSYTGTGATQTINCGFAAGARFVLIKRTDSTGDWYVWDSARGIVAGNDPYLLLNDVSAEVTNTDWVDTAASGFELSNAGGNLVNTNGGSYIFLAVS